MLPKLAAGFDEPLEMLEACHGRIEAQLATLEKMPPHLRRHGADEEARSAARGVMRYFDTAGVLHHQDEEEDLFPTLRARAAGADAAEVAAAIDRLESEHENMRLEWSRLREQLEAIGRGTGAALDAVVVASFARLYRDHMRAEERAILPFARQALDAAQREALGQRMAERRKIKP